MLRKAVVLMALGLLPAVSFAQGFDAGDWELTFGANGVNDKDFSAVSLGGNASIGYFFTDALELSLRQGVNFSDVGESNLNASTRVALDWHFDLGQWQPFVGANIGYVYGDGIDDTFAAAPEVGVKYFVNNTTFIYVLAEYQFFFESGDDADDSFDDGQFVYTAGIGFRF